MTSFLFELLSESFGALWRAVVWARTGIIGGAVIGIAMLALASTIPGWAAL